MICLPNRKRAFAVSSIRERVRKRMGAPFTIMTSPWRSSRTRLDMKSLPRRDCESLTALLFDIQGVRRQPVRALWRRGQVAVGPLLEQAEQRLRCLVGQRQRLGTELLTNLQRDQ